MVAASRAFASVGRLRAPTTPPNDANDDAANIRTKQSSSGVLVLLLHIIK
jgi:hypothetical protein